MIIKLFEEFSDDKQFTIIDDYIFNDITSEKDRFVKFTEEEIEELSKYGEVYFRKYAYYNDYKPDMDLTLTSEGNIFCMHIYKFPDDWYYVASYKSYKCDELKGLINCVKYIYEAFKNSNGQHSKWV